jgi:C4-dicarboxylate-specific signal transduction histidine kinase
MNTIENVQIPSFTVHKWQEIVDLLAEVLHVPSALVMKVEPPNIKVFVSSESEGNPYERDEVACLNTGLYCETVMKARELLLVPNALVDQEWKANPDIKLGMISYMGFPVAWPNGDIFGTICVLDSRRNEYSELYKKLLLQCRDVLQADLNSLQARNELELKVLERTAELRRTEVYLTEAQKLSRTGSFGWNVKSGELFWSDESFRIFGYDKALSPTIDMALQRVHPNDLALMQETIDRASRDGRDIDLEHRLLLPDGSVKNVRIVAHAVQDGAGQLEFNGALMDVTAAKRAEEELIRAQAELRRVARATTFGELTASIAHEINQPLGAMVANGNAGLRWLDRATPDVDEARGAFTRIVRDGRRAGEVIESIRAMFKNVDQEKTAIDINKIIRDMVGLMLGELRANDVSVQTNLDDNLPDVKGNRVQLQQVILNLIRNAIEAMNPVTDRARVLRIESAIHGPDGVLVSVEDSGTGLNPKDAERIFVSFFTTKPQGTGMGLSISRSIIEGHQGRLWASSGIDHGALFNVLLPTARPADAAIASVPPGVVSSFAAKPPAPFLS